jgi:hypothetical protein
MRSGSPKAYVLRYIVLRGLYLHYKIPVEYSIDTNVSLHVEVNGYFQIVQSAFPRPGSGRP